MKLKGLIAAAFAGIISFGAMSTTNADDLGKQGTFSGQIGLVALSENVMAMAENHLYIVGKYAGASTNSSGSGFLQNMAWACGGTTEIVDGVPTGIGYCTVTDQDGDQISGQWSCTAGTDDCDQYFNIGGTGKYEGMQSHNKFKLVFIGSTGHLNSFLWDGAYTIP